MICQQDIEAPSDSAQDIFTAFYNHVQMDSQHILFMAVFNSLYMMPPWDDDVNEYEYEYEDLVELCDRLGQVEVGVHDIDQVTSSIITDKNDTCPICLDSMPQHGCEFVREIHACGHRFCSCCIDTWLSAHKTCPVCKTECIPR